MKSNEALYWINRGNALRQLGQLENALASYNTALLIEPHYSEAQSRHSDVLEQLKQNNGIVPIIPPAENEQTSGAEDQRLASFYQALLASGLVTRIKQPSRDQAFERPLIQIQGKPLSETIIEERR